MIGVYRLVLVNIFMEKGLMSDVFQIHTQWQSKNKPFTYADYSREYNISAPGKSLSFVGTAAPAYKGTKEDYNPEELLVAALSGCHMLSYLAVAANSKIEILAYEDQAEGSLEKQGMSMKMKEVILRPRIQLKNPADQEKALALHDKAHHICFIANSVNFPVLIEPTFIS